MNDTLIRYLHKNPTFEEVKTYFRRNKFSSTTAKSMQMCYTSPGCIL